MKTIIPALVAALFIALGSVGGFFLKSSSSADAAVAAPEGAGHGKEGAEGGHGKDKKEDGHGASKKDGHGASKKGGGGHGAGAADSGNLTYYRFTREFVVPMIEDERVQSLVILNLNLEVDSSLSRELFSKEPVLRDNIMTTLIELSSGGRTLNSITDVENYETLRSMILENLRKEIPEGIHNVLILDMARQDL